MPYKPTIIQRFQPLTSSVIFLGLAFPAYGEPIFGQPEHTKEHVTITLKDFHLHANTTQAKAGWLTVTAVNKGMLKQELVILRTELNPAAFARRGNQEGKRRNGHKVLRE